MAIEEYARLGIEVDSTQAVRGMRSLDDLTGSAKRATTGFAALRNAALAVGAALSVKGFIDVARELENVQTRMRFLTDTTEEAAAAADSLQKFAARVPFEFREISNAAPNLLVVAENTKELNQLLEITGDIAAATGLSFEQTAQQLQRAMSGGIASADLFRERGVGALLGFQQGVQVTAEETKKHIQDLWFGPGGAVNTLKGASAEMAQNWDGIVSMLQDKWFLFRAEVMDSGPFDFLKAAMAEVDARLNENFDSINDVARDTGDVIVEAFEDVIRAGAIAVDTLGPPLGLIAGAVEDMWQGFQSLPTEVQSVGLVGALLFGKKGLVILGAGASAVQNISEITNLIDEQKIARQLEMLDERIAQAQETLSEAQAAFAAGANDPAVADSLLESLRQAEQAMAQLQERRQALIDAPVPDFQLFGSEEEVGQAQSRVEEFLDSVHERIARAQEDTGKLRDSGGLTGSTESAIAATDKHAKALEEQRNALEQIVAAALPYQAKQRELLSQIATLDAAIQKETGSTKDLEEARRRLQEQLTDLQSITRTTIETHAETVEELERELAALRQGEDAYAAYTQQLMVQEETKRRIQALQDQGIELTDRERAQIESLTRAEIELKQQIDAEAEARLNANRAWQGFVTEIAGAFLSSTGNMGDAITDLLGRTQRELVNSGLGALFGFETASTPILSGLGSLFGGGGGLSQILSGGVLLPGAQERIFAQLGQLAGQPGALGGIGTYLSNSAGRLSQLPGGLVGGGLISAGAGFVGGQLGASVFGGEAGLGSTIGGIGGTIVGGPLGAAIGSFVGSAVDKLIAGDGPEVRAAVFAGTDASRAEPKWVVDLQEAASGLRLAGEAQRVGPEGQEAVRSFTQALAELDAALTTVTRGAGFAVDLSGASFGAIAPGEEGARDFVRQWIDEVSRGFDAELEMAAASLGGEGAQQLAAGFETLLNINARLDRGGEVFAGIDSLSETIGLLQGRFAEAGEGLADTVNRLDAATLLLASVGEETSNTVEFFERAANALRGLGSRAAEITAYGQTLQRINDLLSEDRILRDYEAGTRTLFETYQAQTDAIEDLAANLESAADFAALEQAVIARYDTELELIGQIDSALQSVAASFNATIESIVVDGLETERERYEYFRQQADAVAQEILSLQDPAAIQQAAEQYNRLVGQAYQSLSEESRDLLRDDILATVTEMRELTAGLLEDLRGDVTGGDDIGTVIRSETEQALRTLREAVQEAVEAVSQQQAETSRQSTQLVASLNAWAAALPDSIRVQIAGSEVAF